MAAKRSRKNRKKQNNAARGEAVARKQESVAPRSAAPSSGTRLVAAAPGAPPVPTTVEIVGAIVEAIAAPLLGAEPREGPGVAAIAAVAAGDAARAFDTAPTISSQPESGAAHAADRDSTEHADAGPPTPRIWEHRTHPRVAIAVEIDLASESHFFSGLSGDVSEGGVFVQTYRDIKVGSEVAVEFGLPGGHVTAHGKVRWHRENSDSSPPGVGISFDDLSEEDRDLIHRFCQARAPLYYDLEHEHEQGHA